MTIPPYNPQTPLATDTIADGQEDFLTNFSTMFTAFNTNHISLLNPTNPGNHNVTQLIEQSVPRATQGQELAIYSKNVANQTDQLFMRYPLNGKEFQLTQYQIYRPPHIPAQQAAFFSVLPGGIIVYFGFVIAPTTGPLPVKFPITLDPVICSNIMGVNLCPIVVAPAAAFQSNVSLEMQNGKYSKVILSSSQGTQFNIPSQYYLIFGNV